MQGKNKVSLIGMVLLLALMGCDDKGPLIVNDTDVIADWPYFGGDEGNSHYTPVDQITPENVRHLQVAWTYNTGDIECIEAIKASMSTEAYTGYLKGNVQKYVWRYEDKNGVEDLRKAQWYLNALIAEVEWEE